MTAPALAGPARAVERVVGLVPSETPAITASLAAGARLAFDRARRDGGPRLHLEIGRAGGHWATLTPSIVELLEQRHALALITPPERATAHLVAQIGTRSRIPVVTTSSAASVTAAGSRWVVAAVERSADGEDPREPLLFPAGHSANGFLAGLLPLHERTAADGWTVAGYDAALVLLETFRRGTLHGAVVPTVAIVNGATIDGATGEFRIDAAGRRVGLRETSQPRSTPSPPTSGEAGDVVLPADRPPSR